MIQQYVMDPRVADLLAQLQTATGDVWCADYAKATEWHVHRRGAFPEDIGPIHEVLESALSDIPAIVEEITAE
jgi:hypothetical protein